MSTGESDISKVDSVADRVAKELEDLPASSQSEAAAKPPHTSPVTRIFNRERSLHQVFGGGKVADAVLWRNKFMSVGILVGATVIYLILEHSGYTLLSLLATLLLVTFAILFVVSNAAALLNRCPPPLPDLRLSEDEAIGLAMTLRDEVNKVLAVAHDLALGKDFKLLLKVVAVLWGLSVVGGWFHFLTLVYLAIVLAHTVPAVYERYEDVVAYYAKRAYEEAHHRYRNFDMNNIRNKLPRGVPKMKKSE